MSVRALSRGSKRELECELLLLWELLLCDVKVGERDGLKAVVGDGGASCFLPLALSGEGEEVNRGVMLEGR